MDDLLLAADIGGTKTNIACYRPSDARTPVAERHYRNQEFDGLEDLLRRFMEETGHCARAACFAVVGAVSHDSCHMPNLGWHIEAASIQSSFGFRHVTLLNDLAATAHGIATLRPEQFVTLQPGTPDPQGNCALIAAGTGLGEALMIRSGHDMTVSPSEGGHADFAPRDERQIALLRYLQEQYGHASWERVVSGHGLKNLYDFLASGPDFRVPTWLAGRIEQAEDPAAIIADPHCSAPRPSVCRHWKCFFSPTAPRRGISPCAPSPPAASTWPAALPPKSCPLSRRATSSTPFSIRAVSRLSWPKSRFTSSWNPGLPCRAQRPIFFTFMTGVSDMDTNTRDARRIAAALLLLRIGIFIVMAIWTLDKFVRPEHAAAVFDRYYGIAGLSNMLVYALAGAESLLLAGFLLGIAPRLTYGGVLLLHGISTLSAYQQYLHPFEGNHLLFFAAWPMLAACVVIYMLRDLDVWQIGGGRYAK